MAIDSSSLIGVQTIRVNRYDNTGADIAGNIKYARTIRVDHNGTVRGYNIKSVALDPTDSSVYYIQVRADRTSQPGSGTGFTVALAPGVNLDLDYHEYNVLLGNADENVYARNKFKIKHDTLKGIPDNINNILNKSEELAEVKDDIYSDTGLSNARYKGSKNTSTDINVYQAGDTAGFKSPAVEVTQDYYAYFNYIGGTSPELPNKVAADIRYLIGADGTVIDPKTDDDAISFVRENFESGKFVNVQLDDPKAFGNEMSSLNGEQEVKLAGTYHAPITNNHLPALPSYLVSGSGVLRYSDYSVFQHKDTDALVATPISSNPFTYDTATTGSFNTYWITGSSNFTQSISGSQVYGNEKYRQVGVGIATNNTYFNNWVATEELEEGVDYVNNRSVEGRAMDILFTDATGYNTILDPLEIKPFDYITFHSTEYLNWRNTFQVLEVNYNSTTNEVYIRLDRSIEVTDTGQSYSWPGLRRDKFSITRRKPSATLVTLNTDKPPGATSGGILKPKYVSEEAEVKIKEALNDLRGKGMI